MLSAVQFAEVLKARATLAERTLKARLELKIVKGIKFQFQWPIDRYIVDFYIPLYRLVIEIDGSVHWSEEQQLKDRVRSTYLRQKGCVVMRFTNEQVMNSVDAVIRRIKKRINLLKKGPSDSKEPTYSYSDLVKRFS